MKRLIASFSALLACSSPALAQVTVKGVAQGTPVARVFTTSPYCEDIYIQKTGGAWQVVPATKDGLQNPAIEKLRGCLARTGNDTTIDAVVFSLATEDTCETEERCEVNGNNQLATGCHQIFRKLFYKHNSPRSTGYYACNSSFAGRRMLGGMDFNNPVNTAALTEALRTEPLMAAASAIAQSRYQEILKLALSDNFKRCYPACDDERFAIEFLFIFFHAQTTPANLQAAAINYINLSGRRKLPDWASSHLSPDAVAMAETKGAELWMSRYAEQAAQVLVPTASLNQLQAFIKRYETPNPESWAKTDFDKLVPAVQKRAQQIQAEQQAKAGAEARQRAETEEKNRQAEMRRVADWRKSLAVGSDTFCGAVIELRPPMVKLALNVQLQGYANESWLKMSELFPPEYGCRNTNGRLSTLK